MINVRYYGTSHNKLIMKYVGDNQVSLWYKNKQKNLCQIIDFACPYDQRVDNKELEKIKHYQDLARKLRKIWNMKVNVVSLVIGA